MHKRWKVKVFIFIILSWGDFLNMFDKRYHEQSEEINDKLEKVLEIKK